MVFAVVVGFFLDPAATCSVADEPTSGEKIFQDAAKLHLEKLQRLTPGVLKQTKSVRGAIDLMHIDYDAIMTIGPGEKREEVVALYEHAMPKVVAQLANLKSETDLLEPAAEAARKFLDEFVDYRALEAFKLLERRMLVASTAVVNARKLTRPPLLPDPLPSKKTPDVTITKQEVPRTTNVNKSNDFLVTVQNNRRYTASSATIEAGFDSGPGKFLESNKQEITLTPNESRILVFKYTATEEGEVRIGARVVP